MTRIALCGVFDIPNYGDHLFPLVFRHEISRRIPDAKVVLFSPFEAEESFVEDSHIYSLDQMEQMHRENPFDAIVVGGGEIIHWRRYGQKMKAGDSAFIDYPMDKIWVIPAYMHLRYRVPLLWNAPGIPYDFETGQDLAKVLFSQVDYLSVRNEFSLSVLEKCGIDRSHVSLVPDTGFALRSVAGAEELARLREEILPFEGEYAVFHCNRFLPKEQIAQVTELFAWLKNQGLHVVLLPLAYTHGDDDALRSLRGDDESIFVPDGVLSLKQIISVLAGSSIYIGTSLHGTVTSVVWGRKVVSFDYQKTQKTHDLYASLGLSEYYATEAGELIPAAEKALVEQKPVDLSQTEQKISDHFDRMAALITSARHTPSASATDFDAAVETAFSQEQENAGTHQLLNAQTLKTSWEQNDLKKRIEALTDENNALQNRIDALQNKISGIESSRGYKALTSLRKVLHPGRRASKSADGD